MGKADLPSRSRSPAGKRLQAQRGTTNTEPATDELIAGMDRAGADAAEEEAGSDEE